MPGFKNTNLQLPQTCFILHLKFFPSGVWGVFLVEGVLLFFGVCLFFFFFDNLKLIMYHYDKN